MLRKNLRLVLTSAGILVGLVAVFFSLPQLQTLPFMPSHRAFSVLIVTLGGLIGGLVGFALFPLVTWVEGRLARTAFIDILFGVIGLIVGLIIAALLGTVLKGFPVFGPLFTILSAVVFGYLGITIATRKRDEAERTLTLFTPKSKRDKEEPSAQKDVASAIPPKVLDTSVIIDGRIADIVKTGFLEGPLVIGRFVLEELQHIADSPDVLKRNRGRRGLDILNQIQKELGVEVKIWEQEVAEGMEVDSKLVKLAMQLGGKVVTNDFNLNKVAELQGVPVLNINDLANAVKPAVLPGEEMSITVIKEGKEVGQGIAYLDDGTMIVVDGGKRYIGEQIGVTVTSVLQTAAGRMIFVKPKVAERVAQ